ncbi:MAG: hypothetical protein WCX65_01535 [bacterium]
MDKFAFISVLKFLSLNGLVLLSGWLAASWLPDCRRGAGRVLASFVISTALIVLSLELLGAFGLIVFRYVLAAHTAIFIIIFLFYRRGLKPAKNADMDSLSEQAKERKSVFPLSIVGIFAVLFVIAAAFALVMPPAPTDAFLDHLVFPAEWLRAGRITLVQTLSPEQATTYYPANGELIYLWLALPLHDDLLAGAMEAACLLMSVFAAFRIGKKLGLSEGNSAAAAAAAALAPVALNQVQQFGVDLFFAAAFLCSAAFLLPDSDGKRSRYEVLLAGLAAGLALGSKHLGVLLVALLAPLVFAARDDKKKFAHFLLFIAAAALTGSYWYLRNLAVTGSPFYPLGVDLFGFSLFKGAFTRDAMLRSYLHTPAGDLKTFGKIISENIFGIWLLAGAALLLLANISKNKRDVKIDFAPIYIFMLGPVVLALFWFVNPYNIANNARFVIPGIFMLFIFAGWLIERSGRRWSWALIVPGLLIGNWPSANRFMSFFHNSLIGKGFAFDALPLAVIAILSAILFLAAIFLLAKGSRRLSPVFLLILAIAALIPLKSGYMLLDRYDWYGAHYLAAGWRALDSVEEPLTIAYAGNCSPYGLYGNRLKNKVIYANLDGRPNLLFHDYERESRNNAGYKPPRDSTSLNGIFRGKADYYAWLDQLRLNKTDLLFASREYIVGQGASTPIELSWALTHPESLSLAYQEGPVYIFQVSK